MVNRRWMNYFTYNISEIIIPNIVSLLKTLINKNLFWLPSCFIWQPVFFIIIISVLWTNQYSYQIPLVWYIRGAGMNMKNLFLVRVCRVNDTCQSKQKLRDIPSHSSLIWLLLSAFPCVSFPISPSDLLWLSVFLFVSARLSPGADGEERRIKLVFPCTFTSVHVLKYPQLTLKITCSQIMHFNSEK